MRMEPVEDKTAPFALGSGADACLLLHGFTGTPWDIRPLGEALATRGYRVAAPRLPGHGVVPEAMLKVSWKDWLSAAEEGLAALDGSRNVFIAGLSMGALLSLILAAKRPERVRGLALIAPAVRFRGPVMTLLRATRFVPWLEWVKPWVSKTDTDLSDANVLAEAPIIPRFPSARLQDVWTLQDQAQLALAGVKAPTLVAVAKQDHVVDPIAGMALANRLRASASVRTLELRQGFHIIPRDKDAPQLASSVGEFFDGLRPQGA